MLRGNLFVRLATRYDESLRARPLATKAITSGVLNCCADATLQHIGNRQRAAVGDTVVPWNPVRTFAFGIGYGLCWYGPFMHKVTTTWGRVLPSTALPSLFFKSIVDVCTSFPINLCAVISLQAIIRGENPKENVQRSLWASWCAGACFWPTANMVVYSLPVRYRVFCLNLFSYSWNCFMLWAAFDARNAASDSLRTRGNFIEERLMPRAWKSGEVSCTLVGASLVAPAA